MCGVSADTGRGFGDSDAVLDTINPQSVREALNAWAHGPGRSLIRETYEDADDNDSPHPSVTAAANEAVKALYQHFRIALPTLPKELESAVHAFLKPEPTDTKSPQRLHELAVAHFVSHSFKPTKGDPFERDFKAAIDSEGRKLRY